MKAIAVYPGQKNSVHLADLPMPSLNEIPNGRGVRMDAFWRAAVLMERCASGMRAGSDLWRFWKGIPEWW